MFEIALNFGFILKITDVTGTIKRESTGCSLYTHTWLECDDMEYAADLLNPNGEKVCTMADIGENDMLWVALDTDIYEIDEQVLERYLENA